MFYLYDKHSSRYALTVTELKDALEFLKYQPRSEFPRFRLDILEHGEIVPFLHGEVLKQLGVDTPAPR